MDTDIVLPQFLEENSQVLYAPNMKIYSLDHDEIKAYSESISSFSLPLSQYASQDIIDVRDRLVQLWMKLLQTILDSVRFVSFHEFLETLRKVANDFAEQTRNDPVYFLVNEDFSKSNIWVFLLVAKAFLKHPIPIQVVYRVRDLPKEPLGWVIYPDDMSYSGLQAQEVLSVVENTTGHKIGLLTAFIGETALKRFEAFKLTLTLSQHSQRIPSIANYFGVLNVEDLQNAEDSVGTLRKTVSRFLLSKARENVANDDESILCALHVLSKPDSMVLASRVDQYIASLGAAEYQQLRKEAIDNKETLIQFIDRFRLIRFKDACYQNVRHGRTIRGFCGLISIVFQHKLADDISVPVRMLTSSPLFFRSDQLLQGFRVETRGTFIRGCSLANLDRWVTSDRCPPAFYRSIKYTSNGRELLLQSNKKLNFVVESIPTYYLFY